MQTVPDGTEVVATRADAARLEVPPLLIVDAVTEFLDERALGSGPVDWTRIGDGQSNITYRINRGASAFVLRRGPRPPLPKSTHDMVREAGIQQAVGRQGVPVPEILAICADESVLGVPFYVMSLLAGQVVTNTVPVELDTEEQRRATSALVVDTLVKLHDVDITHEDVARFGRPDGYLRRQVERFNGLWDINTTRNLPEVGRLGNWLLENLPQSQKASVVHGDYRTGNLMFVATTPPTVAAVLDWEMATLGDPLADLGYLTATYAEAGSRGTTMELTSATRKPGYLTRIQLIERYKRHTGLDVTALPWYQALAMWKAAIFSEAIYTRWLNGQRPHDQGFGPSLEAGVPRLLQSAGQFAGLTASS